VSITAGPGILPAACRGYRSPSSTVQSAGRGTRRRVVPDREAFLMAVPEQRRFDDPMLLALSASAGTIDAISWFALSKVFRPS